MILFEDRASGVLGKVLNVIENKKFLLPLNIFGLICLNLLPTRMI